VTMQSSSGTPPPATVRLLLPAAPALCTSCFGPDGQRLPGQRDGIAYVWDLRIQAPSGTLTVGNTGHRHRLQRRRQALATSGRDGSVAVWDAASATSGLWPDGAGTEMWGVAFNPDCRLLAGAYRWLRPHLGLGHLHGLHEGRRVSVCTPLPGVRMASAWLPAAGWGHYLWNPTAGQRLLTNSRHTGMVLRLSFSRDSTASGQRGARWACQGLGRCHRQRSSHTLRQHHQHLRRGLPPGWETPGTAAWMAPCAPTRWTRWS